MHLAGRAYVLVLLTAVLAIAGIWSSEPGLSGLWRIPALLLLLGLAVEGFFMRRAPIALQLEAAPRAFLGRPLPVALVFANRFRACARARVCAGDAGGLRGAHRSCGGCASARAARRRMR